MKKSTACFLICDVVSSGMKTSLFSVEGERIAEEYRPLPHTLSGNRAEEIPEPGRCRDYEALYEIYRESFGKTADIFRKLEAWREGGGKG